MPGGGTRRYNNEMEILLNGEARTIDRGLTVAGLLEQAGLADRRVAIEVNRQIVPRSQHATQTFAEGDRVEIVHAIGGG